MADRPVRVYLVINPGPLFGARRHLPQLRPAGSVVRVDVVSSACCSPTLRVPIKHPCWSCGISVLMEDSAESIVSTDVEASDQALIIDRCG
ncbi:hypothetical protein ACWGPD_37505 [Streptomyces hirsutus]|uniref:hypothetical protein n=1 Tax=Streptomyces hirsutus TaxID=35620 RepID=UPI00332446E7